MLSLFPSWSHSTLALTPYYILPPLKNIWVPWIKFSIFLLFSLLFGCLRNSVNSKFSYSLDDVLLGSGSSLDCNCWNPEVKRVGNERSLVFIWGVLGISLYWTLSALKLLTMQHRSLVWLIHSFGVHLSHTQNAHCLQHLQLQQEQQIRVTKITVVSTIVPLVVVSILKC